MLQCNRLSLCNPKILEYIRNTTNKTIEKYKKILTLDYNIDYNIDYNNYDPETNKPNNLLLPIVSFISFLAGYHFHNFVNKFCK